MKKFFYYFSLVLLGLLFLLFISIAYNAKNNLDRYSSLLQQANTQTEEVPVEEQSSSVESKEEKEISPAAEEVSVMVEEETPVVEAPEVAEDSGTEKGSLFSDENYNFQFQYPEGSTVEVREDLNYRSIRLQKYLPMKSDNAYRLDAGEYILEIKIKDPEKGHNSSWSCKDSLENGQREVVLGNGVTGMRGYRKARGDAFGTEDVLCVDRQGVQFHFAGLEGGDDSSMVKGILDSVQFTK